LCQVEIFAIDIATKVVCDVGPSERVRRQQVALGVTLDIDEYRGAFMIEFGETGENSGVR